jgi:hypothetical protein
MAKKNGRETAKPTRIVLRQTKRYLKVMLTEREILDSGRELAREQSQFAKVEIEKAAAAKGYGDELNECRGRIRRLTDAVNDGIIDRDVDCEEIAELENHRVVTVRKDTGEQIDDRAMTDAERQLSLPMDEPTPALQPDPEAQPSGAEASA